ncbi:PBECR4 domain-containing protein [Vagococcus xieshaowenii]|uniref:Phage-Barnase-EndoU-ColicinE5/D-RelE like nuclease 4 domain-containing protein n=1 Tax=Vagococcus xieshaowenii TaxID=2562451 RepID=A0AAJ5JR11_9ENTE|nr:PBECR4 domain-containing protein [Vagococcus xieshaowenii]QCA28889.1 hypothetical protein E4Z98_05985 [Vagococcus xieshaowenii]TFZ43307.1 hypothetical protein E4031_00355 [Vagococcus xieshaowenii]
MESLPTNHKEVIVIESLPTDYKDVRLIDILQDYECNFHGKTCLIRTNYSELKEFKVAFFIDGLPHLLGLHYVSKNKSGTKILDEIRRYKMTSSSIMKHHNFGPQDIKNRIMLYSFLYEVFLDQSVKVCIPMDHANPNPMKLDCVFTRMGTKEEIVLGLKRAKEDGIFKPATLHSNKKAKYTLMKRSKVISIEWE